jgi:hypothetical protein
MNSLSLSNIEYFSFGNFSHFTKESNISKKIIKRVNKIIKNNQLKKYINLKFADFHIIDIKFKYLK